VVIERVEELEARTRRMEARLAALEGRPIGAPPRPVEWRPMEPVERPQPRASFAPPVAPPPRATVPPAWSPPPRRPELSLEDLLGGRVLAWAGGLSLLAGLLRDRRELRIGALALLTVTLAKVALYDPSSLDSMYRVASFVALGMLLLLGAFAWQRLRPEALRDLRDVPRALR
jgi:uncharacterized membrane protein